MTNDKTSRASDSRAADEGNDIRDEFDDIDFTPANLDTRNIPPREGYVQRWVRTQIGGKADPSNVFKSANVGWKPRTADSVKQGFMVPTIEYNGDNVIGLHDTILMERPRALDDKHRRYQKKLTDNQMESVRNDMLKVHSSGSPMGAPSDNSTTRTSTGRPAAISSD